MSSALTQRVGTPYGAEKALGFEYVLVSREKVVIRMKVTEQNVQPYNILHGGVNIVLAESAASVGSWQNVDQTTQATVGLEINANHLNPSPLGSTVVCTATLLHRGRTTHVWVIVIVNETTGKDVCVSRCTIAVVNQKDLTAKMNLRKTVAALNPSISPPHQPALFVGDRLPSVPPTAPLPPNNAPAPPTTLPLLQNKQGKISQSTPTSPLNEADEIQKRLAMIDSESMKLELEAMKAENQLFPPDEVEYDTQRKETAAAPKLKSAL